MGLRALCGSVGTVVWVWLPSRVLGMTGAVQTDATASVYLIALSVGLENHCPSHLPDRWIYEGPRTRWRRFMQLERPHDKQIRLRYFLVGVPIPR